MKHARLLGWMLAMAVIAAPQVSEAQVTWKTQVGAEAKDQGVQADAFLSNELWILEGDSVQWKFVPKNEIHTVTFLATGQVRPAVPGGLPAPTPRNGVQPSGSSYTGAACVNSGPMAGGVTYTVKFPTPGNFKLVCLVHADMNGTIHVLPTGSPLPHDQFFYDDVARDEAAAILGGPRRSRRTAGSGRPGDVDERRHGRHWRDRRNGRRSAVPDVSCDSSRARFTSTLATLWSGPTWTRPNRTP